MATCKSLRRTWLCNVHFIWDMMKAVLWTSKNCTLEPLATLFLPGQSSTAVIRERKRSEQKAPSLSLLIPSYLTQPHFLWQSETKDSIKRENGLKAVCKMPALQSTSSACVSEAMRAGWDGVTVRAVYMTLFLRVYALIVTLCKYLVIKVYLGLFDIFLMNSKVFILIIHTKIKVTALIKPSL